MIDPFDFLPLDDPDNSQSSEVCEDCGSSVIARFGEYVPYTCQSCEDTMALLERAGKLRFEDWNLVVVKVEAEGDVLET